MAAKHSCRVRTSRWRVDTGDLVLHDVLEVKREDTETGNAGVTRRGDQEQQLHSGGDWQRYTKMRGLTGAVTAVLVAQTWAAPPVQYPLVQHLSEGSTTGQQYEVEKKRPLHGRFLQITDFHPDRFYQIYSSTDSDSACHRGHGPAGIYGAETSECDSPIALVNKTMEWVAKEFKDKIDFVIWTGDSARHDNDDALPRTASQVLGLNTFMVQKMAEVFGKHNNDGDEDRNPNNDFIIPIVPNLGNNDILPHNILSKGPNRWTREYSSLWRQFIPESQAHSFQQGGWYYVEVIPHRLAVFSLNTLYFFESNAAADGCSVRSEPGYQQMEWLRIQLQFMRDRGMKAILIGHVPPVRQEAKTSWDETCWQKYTLWTRQFRDVIVSSHYGHFNYDHFMLQDFKELKKDTKKGRMKAAEARAQDDSDEVSPLVKTDYFIQLRDQWSSLPSPPTKSKSSDFLDTLFGKKKKAKKEFRRAEKKYIKKIGGPYAERFSASFVSASVVPNLFPTMRVFEYNTTGLDTLNTMAAIPAPAPFEYDTSDVEIERKKKHKKKKYKFVVPDGPDEDAGPGPAYLMQPLSLIRYTQYFANLTFINNDFSNHTDEDAVEAEKWHEGKHKGKKPRHEPDPRAFGYEEFYDTRDDDVYRLEDLTMGNLLDLARRIGDFVPEEDIDASAEPKLDVRDDDEAEGEDEGDDELDNDSEESSSGGKKHKKHKKKKGKHGKKHKKKKHDHEKENEAWYTFIHRAYVATMEREEIEEEFGR
ncbi:unnamed protein product [Zymoseptoria tritici ST99CH_3D7]|uniref:Endopolyphosphatase n=1 Tax=Zymoseptoria tritici (strain ST99CH_3D7) TaxID=1276538 RepID=A0A1X7RI64_ZYMT9|nr:unnamed protein product [Zymoseptoria tritici ST99CH_3D7]